MAPGGAIDRNEGSRTSIFDPTLTELMYRWFSPINGLILDPFAGGSVRGIVAALLQRRYIGIDLRPEQVAANVAQWERIGKIAPEAPAPRWIVGDSVNLSTLVNERADFLFSCPPYYDLERYSDDPRDLSTFSSYTHFLEVYADIIRQAVALLKTDAFACFVVGDIRDNKGMYRNFPADTTAAFRAAGMHLYNDAILITSVGSLPIRVGKQFESGRKLGKTHQNILVYVKGDPRKIAARCGMVNAPMESGPVIPEEPEPPSVIDDPPIEEIPAAVEVPPIVATAPPVAPPVIRPLSTMEKLAALRAEVKRLRSLATVEVEAVSDAALDCMCAQEKIEVLEAEKQRLNDANRGSNA